MGEEPKLVIWAKTFIFDGYNGIRNVFGFFGKCTMIRNDIMPGLV
ncbi:MAG: hypothetical protein ABIJ21_07830 [Nanoarchaeota archaeon]